MTASEIRSAGRFILRSPRTALAVITSIALGAAAVSAVASLLFAALFRPLPFPDSDRLARVWMVESGTDRGGIAYADLADLRSGVPAFDRVEVASRARLIFIGEAGGRRVEGEAVSDGYFELIGASAATGRLFSTDEYAGVASPVIVLARHTASALFGTPAAALGQTIRAPDAVYTVVGVMSPEFSGTIEDDSGELEFWVPARPYLGDNVNARTGGNTWAVARLARGQPFTRAESEVAAVGSRIAAEHPGARAGTGLRIERMSENWRSGIRGGVWLLFGAASMLLLVAATNVGGMMLAQGVDRRREVAVRLALGASRSRTIALLASEAGLLALIGGMLGVALGPVLLRGFAAFATIPVPEYITLEPEPVAMALAFAVLAGITIVAALVPATVTSRVDPMTAIRSGGRGATGGRREQRWGRALVIAQVALTTVLVATTALLVRSYQSLATADAGFRTEDMMRVALFVNEADAPELHDAVAIQERAAAAVAQQPGVEAVGRVWPTIPIVAGARTPIRYGGMDERNAETGENVVLYAADPSLFDVLELSVRSGRVFTTSDHEHAEPTAVVSSSLAERLGGVDAAVDRVVHVLGAERRVVGVINDAAFAGPRAAEHERVQIFVPLAQRPNRTVSFAIRTSTGDPAAVLPQVRSALANVAPASAIDWTDSYESAFGAGFGTDRFLLALTGIFSMFTLALAAFGIFAVLAYWVTRSRTEIGVRQALGATPARILRSVIARGLALVGTGLVVGFGLTIAGTRTLAGMLFGVGPLDPVALAGTACVLVVVAVVASAWPARRAAAVAPAVAMRAD
jgi:putative ABC transport system permease protein